jgi:hypothetical protein
MPAASNITFSDAEGAHITAKPSSSAPADEGHFSVGVPFWGSGSEEFKRPGVDEWDTIHLAGIQMPGLSRIDGELKRMVDKKKASGVNGVRVTHKGFDAAEFTIVTRLWARTHLSEFQKIVALFRPKGSKAPKSVDCYSPALEILGITSVEILSIGFPHHVGQGIYEVTLKCIEWVPPKKVGVSTSKSAEPSLGSFDTAIPRPFLGPSKDPGVTSPATSFAIALAGG